MDLQTATPAEIDTQLAEIWGRYSLKMAEAMQQGATAARYTEFTQDSTRWSTPSDIARWTQIANEAGAACNALTAEAAAIRTETIPFDAEFDRRGGWTRAYLVDNANGHVHRDMNCRTCYPTTRYEWLTQFSGKTEVEVIEAAGEAACTACYPDAPVDVLRRKSTIEAPARRAAREQREREAAERAAKKAAKAITAADGGKLRDHHRFEIKTEYTAWVTVVDIVLNHRVYKYEEHAEIRDSIIAALAMKTGKTVEEITAEVQAKVATKAQRLPTRY